MAISDPRHSVSTLCVVDHLWPLIYIYIYIYKMPMPTLNVCLQIYMNKKTQHLLKLRLQIFPFFSETLSVYEKAFEKKINICNFNKLCFLIYS